MLTAMQNEVPHQPGLNEIELKLRISQADSQALFTHSTIQESSVSPPQTRRLVSVYYDTLSLQLLDAGISLRVRHIDGGWFQAVKSTGSSMAGLHQRMEWEDIITGSEPDFSKIIDTELATIFANHELRQALKPIFTTDVSRTEWQLTYESSQIELALDMGKLIIHSSSNMAITAAESDISEIELELKRGKPGDVFDMAIVLQQDIALTIENTSKAEYGYAHFRPAPFKSPLSADKSLESPWDCLQALQDAHKKPDQDTFKRLKAATNRLSNLVAINTQHGQQLLLTELKWLQDAFQDDQLGAAINSQRYQGLLLKLAAWLLK